MKLEQLKFDWPTDSHLIDQKFGGNGNTYYKEHGLVGHPGLDIDASFGAPIYSASRGLGRVYKKFNEGNPDLMKYRAVCEIIDLEDCSIEITYGHCHTLDCQLDKVTPHQLVATVGNTGDVYQDARLVTEAEKLAGSTAGRHLHLQVRKCIKIPSPHSSTAIFLADIFNNRYVDFQGFAYLVPDFNNGYNGCIDPMPFLTAAEDVTPAQAVVLQTELTGVAKLVAQLVAWFKNWKR